jgi:HrpA-like RNA helicase
MQEDLFSSYFSCPIVYVEGRTFPVQEHYLEEIRALVASAQREVAAQRQGIEYADPFSADRPQPGKFSGKRKAGKQERLNAQMTGAVSSHRLPKFDAENVAEIVIRIIQTHSSRGRASFLTQSSSTSSSDSGEAVLVFLSGMQAIERVNRALRQRNMSALNARVHILHGSLPPEQQKKVFIRTKPGEWKVILSTNVAETSVTVDDVTHVVDCGLVKEMRYDPVANMSSLEEVVISKASARQRAGRAGRVKVRWKQAYERIVL